MSTQSLQTTFYFFTVWCIAAALLVLGNGFINSADAMTGNTAIVGARTDIVRSMEAIRSNINVRGKKAEISLAVIGMKPDSKLTEHIAFNRLLKKSFFHLQSNWGYTRKYCIQPIAISGNIYERRSK